MEYIVTMLCALLSAAVFAAVALAVTVRDLRREVTRLEANRNGWIAAYKEVKHQRDVFLMQLKGDK